MPRSKIHETRGTVKVDGSQLETLWFAPAQPKLATIVMLHEGLGSVALWKDFPRYIAERTGFGVFVYSRRGNGSSAGLEGKRSVEYMHHEAEVVLPLLLKEMGIEHPILLGHSDGGSIALIYAGEHPNSPRALVLEAPHVFVEELSVESIAKMRTLYQTTDLRSKLGRYHRDVDAAFWSWNDIWLDPRFRSWNIESYLKTIACPVLVIQGLNDEYGTVRQVESIQQHIPLAEVLLLPNCGHSPHRDQPQATIDRIARFLAPLKLSE
jgi:pimeloyl-ACP methyl ester carboxylesterase